MISIFISKNIKLIIRNRLQTNWGFAIAILFLLFFVTHTQAHIYILLWRSFSCVEFQEFVTLCWYFYLMLFCSESQSWKMVIFQALSLTFNIRQHFFLDIPSLFLFLAKIAEFKEIKTNQMLIILFYDNN